MAIEGQPAERLRQFLRQLSPQARTLLITELERGALRGDDIAGGDFVLEEVRRAVREAGRQGPRIGNPARLFFRPIEPFLVDDRPVNKHRGRIARVSLEPIWEWIARDLAPSEAKTFSDDVTAALLADQGAVSLELCREFQDFIAGRIQDALGEIQTDDKARRRLAGQIGTPRAIEDVRDIFRLLKARDVLDAVAERLPANIQNLSDALLETVASALEAPALRQSNAFQYALILVMTRLAAPWQLIRVAVKSAESDDAARIAATPYATAVEIVLAETERMVGELKAELKRGDGGLASTLKWIHDAARGLHTELDLAADSPWGRQLASIRTDISNTLKAEIQSIPGRVRRLLRPRPASEIASGTVLDASDVVETEAAVELLGACRNLASELAISEITQRTHNELQQFLDGGTLTLIDGLRNAGAADRPFRQSQVDAAVRFCAKVFGQEYALLLSKAAEVAANAERKATAKA